MPFLVYDHHWSFSVVKNNKDKELDISKKVTTKIWGTHEDSGTVSKGVSNFIDM